MCASNRPSLPHPVLSRWRTTQFFFQRDDSVWDFDETFNLSEPLVCRRVAADGGASSLRHSRCEHCCWGLNMVGKAATPPPSGSSKFNQIQGVFFQKNPSSQAMLNTSSSGDWSLFLFQAAQLVLHFTSLLCWSSSLREQQRAFLISAVLLLLLPKALLFFFFSKTTEHLLPSTSRSCWPSTDL